MSFRIDLARVAAEELGDLEARQPKKHRKVAKCLYLLGADPKLPGLNSKRYKSLDGKYDQPIWESYVENRTPGAYRVFWHYGPSKDEITVVAITPHP